MRLLSIAIFLLRVAHLTASEENGPRIHALPGMARSTLSVHSVESFARLKACQLPDITACGVFVLLVTRGVRLSYEGAGLTVKETHFANGLAPQRPTIQSPT